MRFVNASIFLFIAVAGLSVPCFAAAAAAADSVATVNGDAISQAEFDKDWSAYLAHEKKIMKAEQMTPKWESASKRMLLDKIIEQRLVMQAAKKSDVKIEKKAVDQGMAQVKAQFRFDAKGQALSPAAQDEAFKKDLAKQNVTEAQLEEMVKTKLRVTLFTNQLVKGRVKQPADEQIRKLFDEVKAKMAQPAETEAPKDPQQRAIGSLANYFKLELAERVRLRHILVLAPKSATPEQTQAAAKKAAEAKAELDKGVKFADAAKKYSDDKATARRGGDAGNVARGQIKELDEAIFSLPVGAVSGVIKTSLGYEIVKVEEKRAAQELSYEGAKKYLGEYIMRSAAQDEYMRFVSELRKSASIDLRASFAKPS